MFKEYEPSKQAKYEGVGCDTGQGRNQATADTLGLRGLMEPPFRITSLEATGTSTLLHMDQASRPQPQVRIL